MPSPSPCLRLFPVALVAATLAGCGQAARQAARDAAPGGIEGSLTSLTEPQNQQRLAEVVRGAGVDNFGHEIGRGIVHGVAEQAGLAPARASSAPTTAPGRGDHAARPAAWSIGGDPEALQHAAAQTTRAVSREAVLGMRDALREMGMVDAKGHPNLLGDRGRGVLDAGLTLVPLAAAVLGLLVVVQAVCIALLLRRMRRERPGVAPQSAAGT